MVEDKKIFKELGSSPDDFLYAVEKSFFLKIVDGPLVSVSPGDTVRLSFNTAGPLFVSEHILPLSLPEVGRYIAIRNFTFVSDGKWMLAEKRDIFKLSRAEALPLLREFKVRLTNEEGGKLNEAKS